VPIAVTPASPVSGSSDVPSPVAIKLIPPSPQGELDNPTNKRTDKANGLNGNSEDGKATRKKRTQRAQQIIREQVVKGQAQLTTISRRIGKTGRIGLHRSTSAPDFSMALARTASYQASSIHSRRRVPSPIGSLRGRERQASLDREMTRSPSPTPPPPLARMPPAPEAARGRRARAKRVKSDLWLMAAATFRRMGRLDQALGAIQHAETSDDTNPGVWVQFGLYAVADGDVRRGMECFGKALVLAPEHVPATVHLAQQYLDQPDATKSGMVDLAAGLLNALTKGPGWHVPEAWFLLAQASGMQGRTTMQRECLRYALGLVEARGVRDVVDTLGYCL